MPQTPARSTPRLSYDSDPETPPSRYVLASDQTPVKTPARAQLAQASFRIQTPLRDAQLAPDMAWDSDPESPSASRRGSPSASAARLSLGDAGAEREATAYELDAEIGELELELQHDLAGRRERSRGRDHGSKHGHGQLPSGSSSRSSGSGSGLGGSGESGGSGSGSGSGSGGSYNHDSMLEVLENDEDEDEVLFDEDEVEFDAGEPFVSRGRGRRRRRRWDENENKTERSLVDLIPPLILAHPLPLLPMLSLLPYNFLPAGVVLFIPAICVLGLLSACAHIVIVYLAWYLKVPSFEEVFATVAGRHGKVGLWLGRTCVLTAVIGLLVGWLETLHPLLQPVVETYLPDNSFVHSRIAWTIIASMTLLPSLLPSRMTRSLKRSPIVLALLLPVVAFLVIGRTVEIKKASDLVPPEGTGDIVRRALGLSKNSSAGAGLTTLTIFVSPHINTLPIHAQLNRNKRSSFPIPCLATSTLILVLSLPLALVPYYLLPPLPDPLPTATPTTPSGVFARLPADDAWLNVARVLMCAVALGSCNMWILRGRDTVLRAMGVERGDRQKAGRWVGVGLWLVVVALACLGGIVAEKIELLGVMATLAVAWFLPSLFFIITFHVRSPLAIVFPGKNLPPPETEEPASTPARAQGHNRSDSLSDPAADVLLARKERQLQKRRVGRRLWQDLIVYVAILPVGLATLLWTFGALLGIW